MKYKILNTFVLVCLGILDNSFSDRQIYQMAKSVWKNFRETSGIC